MSNLERENETSLEQEKIVSILLCTYNGERFLDRQIGSFLSQTIKSIKVYVSDDGSTDTTLDIINHYQNNSSINITLLDGPHQGFAKNFMSLIENDALDSYYYAFSDQDDVWRPDKLERAIKAIDKEPDNIPVLYCSRMTLIDESDAVIGLSPTLSTRPSFQNALLESISCGNTMVFNRAAKIILQKASKGSEIVSHDWWTYIVISGCGGKVICDPEPTTFYRQHAHNLSGMSFSLNARLSRFSRFLQGYWKNLNTINLLAIQNITHLLTKDNLQSFNLFCAGRKLPLVKRLKYIIGSKIYKKTLSGNILLIIAVIFNKL